VSTGLGAWDRGARRVGVVSPSVFERCRLRGWSHAESLSKVAVEVPVGLGVTRRSTGNGAAICPGGRAYPRLGSIRGTGQPPYRTAGDILPLWRLPGQQPNLSLGEQVGTGVRGLFRSAFEGLLRGRSRVLRPIQGWPARLPQGIPGGVLAEADALFRPRGLPRPTGHSSGGGMLRKGAEPVAHPRWDFPCCWGFGFRLGFVILKPLQWSCAGRGPVAVAQEGFRPPPSGVEV